LYKIISSQTITTHYHPLHTYYHALPQITKKASITELSRIPWGLGELRTDGVRLRRAAVPAAPSAHTFFVQNNLYRVPLRRTSDGPANILILRLGLATYGREADTHQCLVFALALFAQLCDWRFIRVDRCVLFLQGGGWG
jgi:hypothetical protein